MRKPLVVVCVGTSAVLLAGAIAATAAGADTTPQAPEEPGLVVPTAGPATPDHPVPPLAGQGGPGLPLPGLAAQAPDAAAEPVGDDDGPHRPGGPATPVAMGKPAPARPAPDHPAADGPAPDQPAPDGPAPDQPAPDGSARDRTGEPAAPRDVAPGSGSGSVSAPVQQQVLALVNDNRRRGGCDDLTLDRRLIAAADRHAADMARRRYFAHRSPSGEGAGERVTDAGYRWSRYGENIARGPDSPDEVVDGWMHSPEHRENIMDCDLQQMGVGLAFADDRTPYWVQDFATPL